MQTKFKIITFALIILTFCGLILALPHFVNFQLLNPKGVIAEQQRALIIKAILLMLVIVLPAVFATFFFAFKYRADKNQAYEPNLEGSLKIKLLWWALPSAIIFCLAILTWNGAHKLDPFRPITSNVTPINVQVVALPWKWLFIYPDYNIATVNYLEFPVNTPVNFQLTADAPMSSFWIPQLGGQIYAMAGMSTQTHLMANQAGEYRGSAAEINGQGFAGMDFIARASSQVAFDNWVKVTQKSSARLTLDSYNQLAKPSTDNPVSTYAVADQNLYSEIIEKYMGPPSVKHIH